MTDKEKIDRFLRDDWELVGDAKDMALLLRTELIEIRKIAWCYYNMSKIAYDYGKVSLDNEETQKAPVTRPAQSEPIT